jgi:hypothetical protein
VISPIDGVREVRPRDQGQAQVSSCRRARRPSSTRPPRRRPRASARRSQAPREYLEGIPKGRSFSSKSKHLRARGRVRARGRPPHDGPVNPHDILRVKGEKELAAWLVNEIQQVYRLQGVAINDKHIEVIVRQMLRRVRVTTVGETDFLVDEQVEKAFARRCARRSPPSRSVPPVLRAGGDPPRGAAGEAPRPPGGPRRKSTLRFGCERRLQPARRLAHTLPRRALSHAPRARPPGDAEHDQPRAQGLPVRLPRRDRLRRHRPAAPLALLARRAHPEPPRRPGGFDPRLRRPLGPPHRRRHAPRGAVVGARPARRWRAAPGRVPSGNPPRARSRATRSRSRA